MSSRTLYLDVLILLAGIFPSGLSYSLSYAFGLGDGAKDRRPKFLLILALPFVVLAGVLARFRPAAFTMSSPSAPQMAIAVGAVLGIFVLEFGAATLFSFARTRRLPRGIVLPQFWAGSLSLGQHALLVLVAVGEELVYRKVGIEILMGSFGWPAFAALAATAVLYSLNHTFFGPAAVVSKMTSGVAYGLLFLNTGSLLVPIVAHVGFNYLLLALMQRKQRQATA